MNQDEHEVVKNLHEAWQAFLQSSNVSDVAAAYRRLGYWFDKLKQHADVPHQGDYAVDDETTYWLELFDEKKEDWFCPGCGYGYVSLVDALCAANGRVEDGEKARVVLESHTWRVVWSTDGEEEKKP